MAQKYRQPGVSNSVISRRSSHISPSLFPVRRLKTYGLNPYRMKNIISYPNHAGNEKASDWMSRAFSSNFFFLR